jgi:hypothetical protein
MEWKINYLEDIDVLSVVITGTITSAEIKKVSIELLEESKKRNVTRVFCDCRTVSLNISLPEVYYLPKTMKDLGVGHRHKVAIVYSVASSVESFFTFFDDCSYNTGLNQKVFADYAAAYQWLLESAKRID